MINFEPLDKYLIRKNGVPCREFFATYPPFSFPKVITALKNVYLHLLTQHVALTAPFLDHCFIDTSNIREYAIFIPNDDSSDAGTVFKFTTFSVFFIADLKKVKTNSYADVLGSLSQLFDQLSQHVPFDILQPFVNDNYMYSIYDEVVTFDKQIHRDLSFLHVYIPNQLNEHRYLLHTLVHLSSMYQTLCSKSEVIFHQKQFCLLDKSTVQSIHDLFELSCFQKNPDLPSVETLRANVKKMKTDFFEMIQAVYNSFNTQLNKTLELSMNPLNIQNETDLFYMLSPLLNS